MKEDELRKHATCSICDLLIGHTQLPLFWTVTIKRWGIDFRAMELQDAFAVMMGSSKVVQVMRPNREMAEVITGPITLTICETCILGDTPLRRLTAMAMQLDNEEAEGG